MFKYTKKKALTKHTLNLTSVLSRPDQRWPALRVVHLLRSWISPLKTELLSYCYQCHCGKGTINLGDQCMVNVAIATDSGFTNNKGQTLHTLRCRNEPCRGLSGLKDSTSLRFSICQTISEVMHCYSSLEWETACPSDFPD